MLQTVRAAKIDGKNGVICVVSMFPSWVKVLKLELSKNVHFLQFCADLSKKSTSIKVIYIPHLKGLVTYFQKIVLFIMLWVTVPEILGFEVEELW